MGRNKVKQGVLGLVACGLAIVWSASAANADAPALVGLDETKPLILPITVQAAYNDDTMFFNIEWEGDRGNTHDLVRFNGTDWQKEGGPRREAQSTLDDDPLRGPTNLTSTNYESRVTWMLNDPDGPNAVPNFEQTGCYGTCHDNSRAMPEWDASTGGANKKYLRADLNPDTAKLDLWHHRQARANPIGMSDDQYVKVTDGSGGRKGDAGGGPYETNSIVDGHPTWVLDDTDTGGKFAFNFEDTHTDPNNAFMQDGDVPPISVATALPYQEALDRGYVPQEGDTVPNRRLRDRRGTSRGDITAAGSSFTPINDADTPPEKMDHFGVIESSVQRALDTGNGDDTALADGEVYDIAFAVHTGMVTVRDHYVGFPLKLSLGAAEGGDIEATKLSGSGADALPNWDDIPELDLELFLPGIASLEFLRNENVGKEYYDPDKKVLVDQFHGGAADVIDGTKSCADCHTVSGGGFMSMENLVPKRGGVWTPTPTLIPEPASLLLAMLAGVVGLTLASRRRRQK